MSVMMYHPSCIIVSIPEIFLFIFYIYLQFFKYFFRFYKYGIKSDWLKVHRVINHRTLRDGTTQYLVKWRELSYDQATWEDEDEDIFGLKQSIDYYLDLRVACNADSGIYIFHFLMLSFEPFLSNVLLLL